MFWQMEDDLHFLEDGRQPSLLGKMEEGLNFQVIGRRPALFGKMEDDLNFKVNGRRPQLIGKWKTIFIFGKWKMTITFSYKLKLAQLTLASPELGTAQPQLVFPTILFEHLDNPEGIFLGNAGNI